MKYQCLLAFLIASAQIPASAQTPMLIEIARGVSVAVISDAAKASFKEFVSSDPEKPTEYDKVKLKELINRAISASYTDEMRSSAFAPLVDYYSHGTITREQVLSLRDPRLRYDVGNIELVELDRKGKFAAVSCTLRVKTFRIYGKWSYITSSAVVLIGDYSSVPKIYAIKERA